MEFTDKETLYKKIKSICDGCKFYNENSCACCFMTECCNAVKNAPVVDAVSVVRCKDCKYWNNKWVGCDDLIGLCFHAKWLVQNDGYCVYGERKEMQ